VLQSLQHAAPGIARRIDLRPPARPSAPTFGVADAVDAVQLEWIPAVSEDVLGYRVERAADAGGPFQPANVDLVRAPYFSDKGLAGSTRYYYRVVSVDSTLLASPPGDVGAVSTNPPQVTGWPLTTDNNSSCSVGIADVNADGRLDIVGASQAIYAWSGNGVELVDADHSAITWGLFYGSNEAFGTVALADLDPNPGKEIVAATWHETQRYVIVLHGDGSVMTGWPQPLVPAAAPYRGSATGPLVVDLDGVAPPEILLAARDGRLYGWHANGTEIANGDANPQTNGVLVDTGSPYLRSAPAVADLDPSRPGAEIVFGSTDGKLYAIDAHGQALPGWPRTGIGATPFGGAFASGAVIGDLDQDGTPEIVVLDGSGRLHAMHLNGSELAGFPISGLHASSQSLVPSPALGNLAGDAKLEIVAAGSDGTLYVFDSAGTALLPGGSIATGAGSESSPILGDVDGDSGIEIVFGNESGRVGAWNLDGTPVDGFPITLRAEARGTPALADANGDGDADLALLAWDGLVSLWDLGVPWRPERAPWPTYRGNIHRTGEFGYAVPTPVAVQDLAASLDAQGAVRLTWHAAGAPDGEARWRIYRAGPFQVEPLGSLEDFTYNRTAIGESRGTGDLEYVDTGVEPGAWYVYVLGLQETRAVVGGETLVGPVSVETTPRVLFAQILPNVPNPFNPMTAVWFEVPSRAVGSTVEVELALYDAVGRRVRTLLHGGWRRAGIGWIGTAVIRTVMKWRAAFTSRVFRPAVRTPLAS
jgi:hypothetical protein